MGFTPGYEEGFNDPNEKGVFLCWKGANPDESSLLGKLTFGGPLAVNSIPQTVYPLGATESQ
ncbi:MAG: hypothetical protein QGI86_03420 [Candidatus Poribacteria bacterium]|nr:hypothetical protein [Candidatus Poribacteria bacterium]